MAGSSHADLPPRWLRGTLVTWYEETCSLCGRGEIVARSPTAEELAAREKVRDEKKLHRQKMNQRRCVAARKASRAA